MDSIETQQGHPMKPTFMTYPQAMQIVSAYGYANKCESLIDTVSDMEDNLFELTPNQRVAMQIVIGEMDAMAEVM